MRLLILTFLLLLLGGVPLHAQQAQMGLRLDVDKREVKVGESLKVTIEFRRVGSGNVSVIRQPTIATPERFRITSRTSSTQIAMDGQQMVEISTTRYTLQAEREGAEVLGPAVMIFQVPGQQPEEVRSNGINVTVLPKAAFNPFSKPKPTPTVAALDVPPPAAPSAPDIRDLKPLLMTGLGWVLHILFWIILAILGVWLLVRVASRFWKARRAAAAVPREGAVLRARYRRLSDEGLNGKEFSLAVSELVRECLRIRHGIAAPDMTTGEVLRALKAARSSPETLEAVEKTLRSCDRVLYADGTLTLKDRQTMRTTAGELLPKGG